MWTIDREVDEIFKAANERAVEWKKGAQKFEDERMSAMSDAFAGIWFGVQIVVHYVKQLRKQIPTMETNIESILNELAQRFIAHTIDFRGQEIKRERLERHNPRFN